MILEIFVVMNNSEGSCEVKAFVQDSSLSLRMTGGRIDRNVLVKMRIIST